MSLLSAASFATAAIKAEEPLGVIAEICGKYCGADGSKEFLNACGRSDYVVVNNLLDQTVVGMMGIEPVPLALNLFSEKFPEIPGLSRDVSAAQTEIQKIKVLARYADRISAMLDRG